MWLILVTAVLASPLLTYSLTRSNLDDYFQSRLSLQSYDSERFATQSLALDVSADQPLGIGPGQWTDERYGHATHSLYLRVLAENGWLALVGFGVFVAACMAIAFRGAVRPGGSRGLYAASFGVLFGIVVESAVIDTLHWRHFMFCLALPAGLAAYERAIRE
jgi:O-antigen ligase